MNSSSSSSSDVNWHLIRQYADAELDALVEPEVESQAQAARGYFRNGPTPRIVQIRQTASDAMAGLQTASDVNATRTNILAQRLELIGLVQSTIQDPEQRSSLSILRGLYSIFQTVGDRVLPALPEEPQTYPTEPREQYDILNNRFQALIVLNTPDSREVAEAVLKRMILLAERIDSPEMRTFALDQLFQLLREQTIYLAAQPNAPRQRPAGDDYERRLTVDQQLILDEAYCCTRLNHLPETSADERYYQQYALVGLLQQYLGLHEFVEIDSPSTEGSSSPSSSRPRSPEGTAEESDIEAVNSRLSKYILQLQDYRMQAYQQRGLASARDLIALTKGELESDYKPPAPLNTPEDHIPLDTAPYALEAYNEEYKVLAEATQSQIEDKVAFESQIMPLYSRMLELQQRKIDTLKLLYADDLRRKAADQSVVSSMSAIQSDYRERISKATLELEELIGIINEARLKLKLKAINTKTTHTWEWTDWGRILLHSQNTRSNSRLTRMLDQLRTNFQDSINSLEDEIKKNETALENIRQPFGQTFTDQGSSTTISTLPTSSIAPSAHTVENELAKLRIARSAAILQRMIDQIGQLVHERDDYSEQLSQTRGLVAWNRNPNAHSSSNSSSSSSSSSEISGRAVELQERIARRKRDIGVLVRAFDEELATYRHLPRPVRGLLETMRDVARNEAVDFATFGMASEAAYTDADEFLTRMRFAEAGYSIEAGVNQWAEWRSSDHQTLTLELVKDFLAWANEHPTEAVRLTDDILLTLDTLQRKDLVSMLQRQMAAKVYMSSFLQTLGVPSAVGTKPIGPHDFRWRALADLAHYGPQTSAGINAATDAFRELIRGNIFGAITTGISRYAIDGYRGRAIQRLMGNIDNTEAQAMHAALSFMRGEPMQQIAAAQARMGVIRLAGRARQLLQDPTAVLQRLFGHFVAPLRQIGHATGRLVERGTRVAALTSPHLVTAFVSLSMYQGTQSGKVNTVAALITTTVVATFMLLAGLLLTRLVNRAFGDTVRRIERSDAQTDIAQRFNRDIENEAERYIGMLRRRQVIPQALPSGGASSSAYDAALYNLVENVSTNLQFRLNNMVVAEQQRLGTTHPLASDAYVALFVRNTPESQIIRLIDQVDLPPGLTHHEAKNYRLRVARLAVEQLSNNWLKNNIQESIKHEFLREYEQLGREDDIEHAVETRLSALNVQRETAVGALVHSITTHTPEASHARPGTSSPSSSYELSEDDRTHVGIAVRRMLDEDPA